MSTAALIEMARSYGLGPWALFTRVILPGALPSILVGLRYALGIMWLTLIVAETISASAGIGYMTMNAREFLQTDVVLLGIIVYALLGKLADVLTRQLEHRCLAWHPAYQTAEAGAMSAALALTSTDCRRQPAAPPAEPTDGPAGPRRRARRRRKRVRRARRCCDGIDLVIPPGGSSPWSGARGGGKSTLLRLLAGLETASAGRRPARRPAVRGPAARRADAVPGRPPAALAARDRQCRHRPRPGLAASARRAGAGRCRPGRPRRRLAGRAVGRPAPARGAGPRPGQPAAAPAAGRAVRRARRADPDGDARPAGADLGARTASPPC